MKTILLSLGILLLMSTAEGETADKGSKVTAKKNGDGVELTCEVDKGHSVIWTKDGEDHSNETAIKLGFQDDLSGEYECFQDISLPENSKGAYYVRFRTGENTIELDAIALVGIIVSNIVATILIGVSVYCIASQSKGSGFISNKASQESDRRNLLPHSPPPDSGLYQQLSNTGRAAEYDALNFNTRRR